MAEISTEAAFEPRSISHGPTKVQFVEINSPVGVTSGTVTAKHLNEMYHILIPGIKSQTAAPTFSGNVATLAFTTDTTSFTAPGLGAADNFAVLAASTITNTGSSVITGDLGLYAGTSVTGFPPGTVVGTKHITDATAQQAQVDNTAAYNFLQAIAGATNESGTDLGTLTLAPGTYKFNTSAQLTGTLTLDAGGDPNAIWVFQIGSTLTTASSSVVSIINGGSAAGVYWAVGSSATIGTSTTFKGNILALTSITVTTSATVSGRLLAQTGAVTLDSNTVTKAASFVPVNSGGLICTAMCIGR